MPNMALFSALEERWKEKKPTGNLTNVKRSEGDLHPYAQATLDGVINKLAGTESCRIVALNTAACRWGHFIAGGVLPEQRSRDALIQAMYTYKTLPEHTPARHLAYIR